MMRFKFIALLFLFCIAQKIEAKLLDGWETAVSCLRTDNIELAQESRDVRIFRVVGGKGYAIVSVRNPNSPKIIGYSETSAWMDEDMPTPLTEWIKYRQRDSVRKEQKKIIENRAESVERHSVLPLLKSTWHQNSPYNDMSPVISDGNVKTAAGCVAIAAAQIANYWKWDNPSSTLEDTPLYPYGAAPVTVSVPKGTPNNWDLILDSYNDVDDEDARKAVAQLVYVVGTTSYLNYASSTSGQISDAANAVYSQFRLLSDFSSKNKFNQDEWENLIYEDLQKGFPVLYSGATASGAGHAFVIDGYDEERNLFHINFGWGGSGNGFYSLDETEGLDGYCTNQSCVYGIRPQKRNVAISYDMEKDVSGDSITLKFGITNSGTLPLTRITVVDGSIPAKNELAPLDVNVPNDNMERKIDVTFSCESLSGITSISLIDDWGTNLGNFNIETAGINHVRGPQQNRFAKVYDLTGKPVLKRKQRGIYLISKGNGYQKVILHDSH